MQFRETAGAACINPATAYTPLHFRSQPMRCPAGGGTQDGDPAVEDRCQKERKNRSKAQAADDPPTDGNAQFLRPN